MTIAPVTEFPWGPVLTAAGLVINFGFNIVNYRRTSSLKRRDMRVEEFKRLRTRLDTSLDDLRGLVTSLRSLSLSAAPSARWQKELAAANVELAQFTAKLSTVLGDIDASSFAHGTDWLLVVEPHLDNVIRTIDGGHNTTRTMPERKGAVADASSHLEALIGAVNRRVDAEMKRYADTAAGR